MEQYRDIEWLAGYLGLSTSTVYQRWRRWAVGGLRVYLVGSTPRFKASDVDRWLLKHKLTTTKG